jgi:glycine oxidase
MEVDFIVIGNGLAGISFSEQLRVHQKSFVVFDNASQRSSTVAGGLYNPVVLKRFTPVWKSKEQLQIALEMYAAIESEFNIKIDYKIPVLRKFASSEEQNDWFSASDKSMLSEFLSTNLVKNHNLSIDAPYGFGEVLQTGRIDVIKLMETYKAFLLQERQFFETAFLYDELKILNDGFQYFDIKSKYIVFTEGYGIKKNKFFKDLPLIGTKGELLTIHAPDLKLDYVLKSAVFIIPLGNDLYKIGSTYNWTDRSDNVTKEAKEELLSKLNRFINCSYKVVDQVAGIRPTVKDRRPIVGRHAQHKNMYVLNGLGTRGVMIGPYVAKQLFDFIENGIPLDKEIDLKRFE